MIYRVGDGCTIHWSGGVMIGGIDVPAEYLAEIGPHGLAVALKVGSIVDVTPPPASRSEQRRRAVQESAE